MARIVRVVLGTLAILLVAAGVMVLMRGTGGFSIYSNEAASYREAPLPVEFVVCTYNVQGRPVLDDTKAKFPEIGQRLSPFDIVGLQECFVDDDLIFIHSDFPTMVYDGTLRSPFKLVGSGLANLGRFPVIEAIGMHYSSKGEFQNRPASKGILLTRHDIGGHTVDVYNTHMEAGGSDAAMEARRVQVKELAAFVHENSPPAHSVIFVGDFNMSPLREHHLDAAREEGYDPPESGINFRLVGFQRMMDGLGEGFRDASDEIHGTPGPYSEKNQDAPWWRRRGREDIDRILFRAGEGVTLEPLEWEKHIEDFRADDGELLSDHDPISVRFRLEAS